ncbi:UNVERIFIED_CONTAM: hypothetical protein FKN15_023463 [Acipenser sinensis]
MIPRMTQVSSALFRVPSPGALAGRGLTVPLCLCQVHVGSSVAPLGGKLFVSGGYDDTFELSDVVEAYDPSTGTWSRAARLPQPTFWHGSVSIFRQFMPSAPSGFEAGLDNANNEINTIHLHRHHHHNHRAQALLDRNHNLNQVH